MCTTYRFYQIDKIQNFSSLFAIGYPTNFSQKLLFSLTSYISSQNQQLITSISQMILKQTATIVIISIFLCLVTSRIPRFPVPKASNLIDSQGPVRYQVLYFNQKVSHYNYRLNAMTFKQKYLFDSTYWNKTAKGPILMYCGNEGPIQMFYKNTGWYNDYVSKQLQGLILYPQHRYFGQSMPFGDQKTSYRKENLIYLTTEEAIMDFAQFIKFIKKTYCKDCPVVAFGGSFGGMLATWMRMKYPHIVDMAHAASAPIYYYRNRQNFDIGIFYKIVTKNYLMHSANCANIVRQGFKRLIQFSANPAAPIQLLSVYFNLCKPLKSYKDIPLIMDYIDAAYSYLAMLNYPYPTSFLKNLTSWPANSSCQPYANITPKSADKQLFNSIRQSIQYYYSYNQSKCNQIYEDSSSDYDMSGWDILACGDQAMPMDTDGVNDMYYPSQFNYDQYSSYCNATYGIMPDYDFTLNHFGGVTDQQYKSASKIIFTNGGLDPWSGASPLTNLTSDLLSCYIDYGAHHLDLRPPNAADPRSATQCRAFVLSTLKKWLGRQQSVQQLQKQQQISRSIRVE